MAIKTPSILLDGHAMRCTGLTGGSVGATLSSGTTEVHHGNVVREIETGAETAGEVIVLGPRASAVISDPVAAR
jgi:glutamate synthase domain-containing protein 3